MAKGLNLTRISPTIPTFTFFSEEEVQSALDLAWEERLNFRKDLKNKALEIIKDLEKTGKTGVVLCGRPYHCDKEIHHGIPNIINSFGIAVLTGDAVASISSLDEELRVVDQWTYHSRLYRAAAYVGKSNCLELIELNSFSSVSYTHLTLPTNSLV